MKPHEERLRTWAAIVDARLVRRLPLRPLIVGQAPPRNSDGWPALTGRAGDRLARLAGLSIPGSRPAAALMVAAERENLIDHYPGKPRSDSGDVFPLTRARSRARDLLERMEGEERLADRRIVLLGRVVSRCFGFPGNAPWYEWRELEGPAWNARKRSSFRAAVIPHPSGRSRLWNDEKHRTQCAAFLRELFQKN